MKKNGFTGTVSTGYTNLCKTNSKKIAHVTLLRGYRGRLEVWSSEKRGRIGIISIEFTTILSLVTKHCLTAPKGWPLHISHSRWNSWPQWYESKARRYCLWDWTMKIAPLFGHSLVMRGLLKMFLLQQYSAVYFKICTSTLMTAGNRQASTSCLQVQSERRWPRVKHCEIKHSAVSGQNLKHVTRHVLGQLTHAHCRETIWHQYFWGCCCQSV